MGNLVNPGSMHVTVALAEKTPEQARHDALFQWAVTDGGLRSLRDEHMLDNFRNKWNERRFQDCYLVLMKYLKYTPDADFARAKEWKVWIESISTGFVPA